MKISTLALLAVALWKPASAQMAAQITEAASPRLSSAVSVKTDGVASVSITRENGKQTQTLDASLLRADGSVESETDSFYQTDKSLAGSMTTRFDAQSRLIEYSIADVKGKTTTTRVAASAKAKTPHRIKYFSSIDGTDIIYNLNDFGRVQKKETRRPQQNAKIVTLYNERGVPSEMTIQKDGTTTHLTLFYNEKNQLTKADSGDPKSGQMLFAYDAKGHLSEMKVSAGEDVTVTSMTYNAAGKPLETSIVKNGKLQMRFSTHFDEQNRPTSAEIRDGDGRLIMQSIVTYSVDGKSTTQTTIYDSDGTQTVVNSGAK